MLGDCAPQALGLKPLVGEQPVCVSVGTVGKNGHHCAALTKLFGHFLRRDHVKSRASTEVKSLFIEAAVNHLNGLLVADVHRSVQGADIRLEVVRDATLTNALSNTAAGALGQLSTALNVTVKDTAGRIREERLHAVVANLLEVVGNSGKGTTRASRAGERIKVSPSLRPDLWTGGLDVRSAVCGVIELIGPHSIVQRLGVSPRLVVVVLWVVESDCWNRVHLGTEETQKVNLALRLCVGHVDDQLVALRPADVRETNSGIPCCSLHDCTAGLQKTPLLRILDDEQRSPVLDTASGVLKLGFTEDVATGLIGESLKADKGGIPNGLREIVSSAESQSIRSASAHLR